jgi:hypothetical protein
VVLTGYAELRLTTMNLRVVSYNDPWPPDCSQANCQPANGGQARLSTYDAFVGWPWWATFHTFRHH